MPLVMLVVVVVLVVFIAATPRLVLALVTLCIASEMLCIVFLVLVLVEGASPLGQQAGLTPRQNEV